MIDIKGLDKASLLVELHSNSFPQGLGVLHERGGITYEEAKEVLAQTTWIDYLSGRVMKVELGGDELEPWLYDRDVGEGEAAKCVEKVRSQA